MSKKLQTAALSPASERTRKRVCCALSFVLGYVLIRVLTRDVDSEKRLPLLLLPLFAGFALWGAEAFRGRKKSPERFVWLAGCAAVTLRLLGACRLFPFFRGRVWDDAAWPVLFAPIFASLWVLSLSGLRFSARSGRLLPFDLEQGLFRLPVRGYPARFRFLESEAARLKEKHGAGAGRALLRGVLTAVIALGFFLVAALLLCGADERFAALAESLFGGLAGRADGTFFLRAVLSILPGGMLFALFENARSAVPEEGSARARAFEKRAAGLRRLPARVWGAVLCVFSAMYALFFALQGTELLPAAARNLAPGSMTMAEYARRGFFELCGVTTLNFLLLGVCALSSDRPARRYPFTRMLFTVILIENTLFAALDAFKLVLYVRSFGFTPLRLQGAFGTVTLAAACVCALVWLFTGRRTAHRFLLFTAGLLTVTLLL